jgi:hypothetical protein
MDGRRNNGGNSTKAKGVDKRKNQYRQVLSNTLTPEDLSAVINMLYKKAIDKQDVKASQILLEYYLGKPKETIEATHNINDFNIKDIVKFK